MVIIQLYHIASSCVGGGKEAITGLTQLVFKGVSRVQMPTVVPIVFHYGAKS